ncbi:hypothetical protein [Phocaeicola salanitronis]|uniref:hypothetical protein n=1 Tax=Phocaeicola salanitronis TaxID=376805 RepID=UPI0023F71519|nr:hypothetical protein [Phocaeicola salanitronis]
MKKKAYVAPETEMRIVELEQGFMNTSVVNDDTPSNSDVNAGNQKIEGNYDFTDNLWE